MARGDGLPTVESKWKFPKAFEGVTRLFGAKKEQPEQEPDLARFSVLDGLKNTDKKELVQVHAALADKDRTNNRADISAHIIEILGKEIGNKEVDIKELEKLAWVLLVEIEDRPPEDKKKKKPVKDAGMMEMDRQAEEDRMAILTNRIKRLITDHLGSQKTWRKLTAEEEARLESEALHTQSAKIAEKIRKAPSKFDGGLSTYMETEKTALNKKEQDFLAKKRFALDEISVKKILHMHPNDYESAVEGYEEVFAKAGLLDANGMAQEAGVVRNLDITFSPIDGAALRNPDERLAYIESLLNPGSLMAKWRTEKPPNFDKDWAAEFVSDQVIPDLLTQNTPFEEVVKQMQWFQVAGSFEQKDAWKVFECDLAGVYRKIHVSVDSYPGPNQKVVPDMMAKLAAQVELFSAQLETMRGNETPESFEEKVHQFACDVLHKFVAIHPMIDGNGRTGRSLREYIIAKHLGPEKMREYAGAKDAYGTHGNLLHHLRFGQPEITREQMEGYHGSELATKYRADASEEEKYKVGYWHEPLMAHLTETDIQAEVFDNKKIIEFAKRARGIIDGKKLYE